jgi:hypothetical protein
MLTTQSCVRLSNLSSILREEYRRRSDINADNSDPKKVAEAEAGIRRAHELLRTHREDCPTCIAYEREAALQSYARKPVNSESEVFRLDRVG